VIIVIRHSVIYFGMINRVIATVRQLMDRSFKFIMMMFYG